MTPAELLTGFFFFMLAAVSAAGYVFRIAAVARSRRRTAEIPAAIALEQPDMPSAQAAVFDMFRLIGEAMPGTQAAGGRSAESLVRRGYRWPSAVSFSGD